MRSPQIFNCSIAAARNVSPVIASKLGADAAALAYDAFEKAKEAG
ncbi:MAG: signal recognition particle-docking protein FtsY, partial [Mesorhizobium sp.]